MEGSLNTSCRTAGGAGGETMRDQLGREIDYLRISVTTSCNLRCQYCRPSSGCGASHSELGRPQITRFVRAAASLGVRRVRLTGGEPLLRRDLDALVSAIAATPGIDEVSLTTNAQRLADRARSLRRAGLRRVNISLDTLLPERYRRITGGGELVAVWRGLQAAEAAGLNPIHLNVVVVRGVNDDEIMALARLTQDHPWDVRFIELMPFGTLSRPSDLVSADEIWSALGSPPAAPDESAAGPARYFRLPGAIGRVGLIAAVTQHPCARCNRIRLTAEGKLRPCLLADTEVDLRPLLKSAVPIERLRARLAQVVAAKPAAQPPIPPATAMSEIGG